MRSREFLGEYNQAITAQRFGPAMLARSARDVDAGMGPKIVADMSDAKRMELITNLLTQIELADPTPNKQYVPWLAKMYAEGGPQSRLEDLQSTVKDALTKFHELKIRRRLSPLQNDIMRYVTAERLLDIMAGLQDPREPSAEKKARGQATEIIRTNTVRVIVPKDQAAACYYGQGTRWCTAAQNNNMFDAYADQGPLYILIPQQPKHPGEKYQMSVEAAQAMNEKDQPVDPWWLVTERFGDIRSYFKPYIPAINSYLMFADPALLVNIMERMEEMTMNHAQTMRKQFDSAEEFQEFISDLEDNLEHSWNREWLMEDWAPNEDPPLIDELPLGLSSMLYYYGNNKVEDVAYWVENNMSVGKIGGTWRVWET